MRWRDRIWTVMRDSKFAFYSLKMLIRVGLLIGCCFCVSARAAESIVVRWNSTALQAIRETHAGPPQAARALAMAHTCMYDAWAAYDPVAVGTRLGSQLRRPLDEANATNKKKAISYAAYRCLSDIFPRQQSSLHKEMADLGYDPNDTSTNPTTPVGIGNVVAAEVIKSCHHDGANQLGDLEPGPYEDYTGYEPVNGPDRLNDPNRWQPLRVIDHGDLMIQRFIVPFWNRVSPFALASASQFRTHAPYSYEKTRRQYIQQALDLIDISARLTERQKVIADYWADGPSSETPPGHWCLFAQFVSARDHNNLDMDVKMFFALTNALLDASIAAWDTKRAYDSVRPITAIRFLFSGKSIRAWAGPYQDTREIKGAEWTPYQESNLVTPAFPEYPSGHSAFSAAGAEILRLFTGTDAFKGSALIKAGTSRIEPGSVPAHHLTLFWNTFTDAANEAGMSRRYGGIHFQLGEVMGRKIGRMVADQTYAKALSYFHGLSGVEESLTGFYRDHERKPKKPSLAMKK